MWALQLLSTPLPRLILASVLCGVGGYYYGYSNTNEDWKIKLQQIENEKLSQLRKVEIQKVKDLHLLAVDYENEKSELQVKLADVERDYSRLRLKPSVTCLPTNSRTAAPTNAEDIAPTRLEQGEVNLDDVAREVISLGNELDNCYIKVDNLQKYITSAKIN